MKKTTIVLLLLALIAGLFISCSQEMTVDADVHNKINDIDTFCINGKYFSTLQAAVDYFKDSKAMKAPGDNDNVIYLTRNASGPGADIVDIKDLVIDFAGFTYSFTNVTAIQGETGGKFGLSITDGSKVTLKGLEQINLFDTTDELTMVYIEGSDTSLTIEDAPKMVVEPTQYVFWAANGATLTIGSTDATKEASITGKIAATGGETEESAPSITVQAKTTITGSVEATKASVTLSGTSKITGAIEVSASKVSVSGAAKIDVELTAKDESQVVINTVATGAEASVIKTMDKEETSTVVVAGGTVNVEEVAEGSDAAIEVASGDATVEGEGVQKKEIKSYVAKINGKSAYATMEEAIEAASTTGHRDEIILLQSITEKIEIPHGRDVIITSKNFDVGSGTDPVEIKVSGSVVVKSESNIYGNIVLESGSVTVLESGNYTIVNYDIKEGAKFTITGGTYNFNPTSFVPAYCEVSGTDPYVVTRIAKDDAVAEIAGDYYKDLQVAINDAEDGDTVKLLTDITQDAGFKVDKANMDVSLDLNGKTITVNTGANINNRAFRIDYGTLRVSGGTIVAVGSGTTSSTGTGCYGAFRVEKDGTLFAENMNLSNARPWGLNVKVLGGEATLTNVTITSSYGGGIEVTEADLGTHSKPGKATLTDCTFNQTGHFDHCSTALSVSGGSELIVNSGTYSGEYGLYVFSSGGYITVKDGNFTGKTKDVFEAAIDTETYPQYIGGFVIEGGSFTGTATITSPATMSITGGVFSFDPTAYVAEGYVARKTGDVWTVSKADDEVAVTIGSTTTKMSLLDFAKKVNNATEGYATANVELLKDVNLSGLDWTPIGTQATPFKGEFYGAGNTIKNLTVNVENGENIGIFGAVQDATIHDVSIENAHVIGSDKVGILIGRSMGGTVSISDVKIDNDSYAEGEDSIGGLIGSVKNSKTIIKNTSVAARVTATEKGLNKTSRAGGFVGADGSNQIIFDNCEFTGHCKGKSVAGFIAHCMLNNKVTPHIFLNCDASGELELLNVQQTDNYCDMGNLISAIWYGPSVFVIDTTVHGEEITEVSQGFGGVFGRVVDIDGGASVCYYIKNAESFISDFVSNTTYSGFAGSYEISVDNDYIVTVVAGTDFKIISGGTTVYLDAVSIIGTDGSKLTATIGTTSGNNGSFKVSGTNCNFFDNNGTPITDILSGYYDMSGNVIGYHNLVFDWDSTLNGWKLQQEYQHYYDDTTT